MELFRTTSVEMRQTLTQLQRGAAHVFAVRLDLHAVGRIEREIAREIVDVQRVVGPVHGKSVTIML